MISSSPRKCQENTKTKPQNGNAAKFKSHRNCDVAGEILIIFSVAFLNQQSTFLSLK